MNEDQTLVASVIAGTPGAFESLVKRYQGLVWHMVYRMVQHPEDARELSQEAFLRVHQCLHQYRGESSLGTWIGRVAYSIALRHLERKRLPIVSATEEDDEGSLLDTVSDGVDLESNIADSEIMSQLNEAITQLPALQRTLVTLYHLDELPISEIATITGLPEGTVKSYLFRARLKLRQSLEQRVGVCL